MTTDRRAATARRTPQLIPRTLLRGKAAHNPVVLEEAERRNRDFQLRLADRITTFAGSMNFVWMHAAIFAVWMLALEKSPWPTLTLVVSLEAIFLSAFVMIGQNRQSAFQQAKAEANPSADSGVASASHQGIAIRLNRSRSGSPGRRRASSVRRSAARSFGVGSGPAGQPAANSPSLTEIPQVGRRTAVHARRARCHVLPNSQ
jgi:hypothetical protein